MIPESSPGRQTTMHPLPRAALGRFAAALRTGGRFMIDRLLPARCALCAGPVATPAALVCPGCNDELPRLPAACPRCAMPNRSGTQCASCLRAPPPFERTVAWAPYAYPIDRLVQRLKYHGDLALARLLGLSLARMVADAHAGDVDLIVPLPLAARRQRERGFNQAAEIAKPLARALGRPLALFTLERGRETAVQAGLARAARHVNLRGAFGADAGVIGRRVAIVDDVMTTGATLEAAARAALDAGALAVHCWVVARAYAAEAVQPGGTPIDQRAGDPH